MVLFSSVFFPRVSPFLQSEIHKRSCSNDVKYVITSVISIIFMYLVQNLGSDTRMVTCLSDVQCHLVIRSDFFPLDGSVFSP